MEAHNTTFTYRDESSDPTGYYYIRVLQSFSTVAPGRPGEVAWSSPIYVNGP